MLFLVAIGAGAAVLEVHRALTHSGSQDVTALREKEAELRRQLQASGDSHAAMQSPPCCRRLAGLAALPAQSIAQ
jgi:hypothetical protein